MKKTENVEHKEAEEKTKKENIYPLCVELLTEALKGICQKRKDQELDLNFLDIKQNGRL